MKMRFQDKVKFKLSFWAITLPVVPYFVIFTIIATLNPLWFREDLFRVVQQQLRSYNNWRQKLLKPQLDKYRMFEILKQNSHVGASEPTTGPTKKVT